MEQKKIDTQYRGQLEGLIEKLQGFIRAEQYHQILETVLFCIKLIEEGRCDCDDVKFCEGLYLLLNACKQLLGLAEEFFYSQRLGAVLLKLVEALRNQAALSGQKSLTDFIDDCLPYTIDSHIPYKTLCNHECGSVEDFFPSHLPNPYHLLNEMHTECLRKAQSNLERYLETAIVTRVIDYWRTLFNTSNECGDIQPLIELGEDLLGRIKECADPKRKKALWKMLLLLQMLLRDHPAVKTLKVQDWPAEGFVQSLLPFEYQSSSLAQQSFNKPPCTLLKDYRSQLQESRLLFEQVTQGKADVFEAQENHSQQVIKMLEEMAIATRKLLGPPPCEIVVCILGSTSRHDRRPYSDLEYMILHREVSVDKQQDLDLYICHFISIFELMIVSLGETSSNHNNNRNGFKIDQSLLGLTVSFKSKSWGTPEEVAKKYVIELNEPPHAWLDKGLFEYLHPIALECPELGSRALFEQYLKELDGYLNQIVKEEDSPQAITQKFKITREDWWKELTRRQGIALASLCEVVDSNENMYLNINAGRKINLKTFYYKPLLYCALSLGMYEGCQALTPSKTIEAYCAKMPWGGEALLLWWQVALRYVLKEQVKQHLIEGCQHDSMIVSDDACWAGFDLIVEGFILPLQRGVRECLSGSVPISMLGYVILKGYLNARHAWLEKWQDKGLERFELLNHPLIRMLASYPDESGWSPQMELLIKQHHEGILKLSTDRITACEFAGLPVEGKQPPRYLNEEILQQCIKNGEFVGDPELSSERSQVKKVTVGDKSWYLKVKEGNLEGLMAREYLAMMLHLLLGGKPQVALGWPIQMRSEYKGEIKYHYAWVSEGIEADSLSMKMRSLPDEWQGLQLDRHNFSQLFLFAFLTCPEDGQPQNFKIIESEGKIKLIAIDYGQCFIVADRQEKSFLGYTTSVLTIKTIIYLLGAMHLPLSEELLTRIRLLDVEVWYERWKKSQEIINEIFQPLLKEDLGFIPSFHGNKSDSLIDIPDGVLLCIKSRLKLLQHWLRTTQKPITGQSILESLEPLVASQYAFLKPVIKTPEDFYQKIDVKAYVKDPKSGKTVSSATWTSLKEQTLTPQQLARSCDLSSSYFRRVKFKYLNEAQQEYHIQLLESVAERKGKDFIKLNLSGSRIKESRLIRLLEKMPHLRELDLCGCEEIKVMSIVFLLAHRPNAGFFTYNYDVLCPRLQAIKMIIEDEPCALMLNMSLEQRQLLTVKMRGFIKLFEAVINKVLKRSEDYFSWKRKLWVEQLVRLGKVGDRVNEALLETLGSGGKNFSYTVLVGVVVKALGELGKAEDRVIVALVKALGDSHSFVRISAANALGRLGRAEGWVIEALLKALSDSDESVCISVAQVLGRLGKAKDRVIEVLLKALTHSDWHVNRLAIKGLERLGKEEDWVIEALLKALGDSNARVSVSVAYVLERLGKGENGAIEICLNALTHSDQHVELVAIKRLGRLGKAEDRVIEALLKALTRSDLTWSGHQLIVQALGRLGKAEEQVIEALIKALEAEDMSIRISAAKALGRLGRAEDRVIEALLKALGSRDSSVRISVVQALVQLGKAEKRVIVALLMATRTGMRLYSDVARSVTKALGRLGRAEDRVIEALLIALWDGSWYVRQLVIQALGRLEKMEDRVTEALLNALANSDPTVSQSAAIALARMGRAEGPVLDAVLEALGGVDWDLSISEAKALRRSGKVEDRVLETLFNTKRSDNTLQVIGALLTPQNYWNRIQDEIQRLRVNDIILLDHTENDLIVKRVFFFVDDRARKVLPQVCRKWRDLYDEFKEEQRLQSVPELRLSASFGYQRPFSRDTFFRTPSYETENVSDKEVSEGEAHQSKLSQMQTSDPDMKRLSDEEEVVNHREENKFTK